MWKIPFTRNNEAICSADVRKIYVLMNERIKRLDKTEILSNKIRNQAIPAVTTICSLKNLYL